MSLSKRAMRCLKRIDANKSSPDIDAMDELEANGAITCEYGDGECTIRITKLGRAAIAAQQGKDE